MPDREQHWEDIYTNNSPLRVSWYQELPLLSMQLIRDLQIKADSPILDVGGGAATLVDKLCHDGYTNVSVLDISATALRLSKERLAGVADSVTWYLSDVTTFRPPHPFTVWHDRASFHFLTAAEDRARYRDVLNQALRPGGHAIIMTFALDGPQKCSGLEIVRYDSEKLTAELGSGFDLLKTGHETHRTPSDRRQKFAYFHLRKR